MTATSRAHADLQQQRVVRFFRAKQATRLESARLLRELGLNDGETLRGMVALDIVRKAGPDRYFLDERVWASRRNLRSRDVVRIAVVLALALFAVALYVVAGR